MRVTRFVAFVLAAGMISEAAALTGNATLTPNFAESIGPMDHIFLGQGGLSPDPISDNRVAEFRALPPLLIRLFILVAHRRPLDAESPSEDENARLRPLPDLRLLPCSAATEIHLEPLGMESWAMEPADWCISCLDKTGSEGKANHVAAFRSVGGWDRAQRMYKVSSLLFSHGLVFPCRWYLM